MSEYSVALMENSVRAIRKAGQPMRIEEVLEELQQFSKLRDAAENVIIAQGMGWDMEGVLQALAEALPDSPRVAPF